MSVDRQPEWLQRCLTQRLSSRKNGAVLTDLLNVLVRAGMDANIGGGETGALYCGNNRKLAKPGCEAELAPLPYKFENHLRQLAMTLYIGKLNPDLDIENELKIHEFALRRTAQRWSVLVDKSQIYQEEPAYNDSPRRFNIMVEAVENAMRKTLNDPEVMKAAQHLYATGTPRARSRASIT